MGQDLAPFRRKLLAVIQAADLLFGIEDHRRGEDRSK
jgi:hypothetical protein